MPAKKSALKRIKTSEKEKLRNKARRSALKTSEKKFRTHIEAADIDKAKEQLEVVFKKLDKAVKVGTIHKNKCNRKKSRLAATLNNKANA